MSGLKSLFVVIVLSQPATELPDGGTEPVPCEVVYRALSAKIFARGINRKVALIEITLNQEFPAGTQVPIVVGTEGFGVCSTSRYSFSRHTSAPVFLALSVHRLGAKFRVAAELRSNLPDGGTGQIFLPRRCVDVVGPPGGTATFVERGCEHLLPWPLR